MGIAKGKKKELSEEEQELIQRVAQELKRLRFEAGHTSYENFAFDTRLPRMMAYRMEKGDRDFNFTTLMKVLGALGVKPSEFFESIGM